MKKRKGYRAGTSSVRQDYREGGRVQAANGGVLTREEYIADYKKNNPEPGGVGMAGLNAPHRKTLVLGLGSSKLAQRFCFPTRVDT